MKPFHVLGLCVLMFGCGRAAPQAPAKDAPAPAAGEAAAQEKKELVNNDNPVRDLVGKLQINTIRDNYLASNYWLYVNGRIVSSEAAPTYQLVPSGSEWLVRNPDGFARVAMRQDGKLLPTRPGPTTTMHFETSLLPGEYKVEVALTPYFAEAERPGFVRDVTSSFPFVFRTTTGEGSWRINMLADATRTAAAKVEAGKTTDAQLDVNPVFKEDVHRNVSEEWWAKSKRPAAETVKDLEGFVQKMSDQYRSDPLVKALWELRPAQPQRAAVFIDLPQEYGGGREFDARQIPLLVRWLKNKYWDTCLAHYDAANLPLNPGDTAQGPRYEAVKNFIFRNLLENEKLNEIGTKLQQARK